MAEVRQENVIISVAYLITTLVCWILLSNPPNPVCQIHSVKSTSPNPVRQTPSKRRFGPRWEGVRGVPDRDFTGQQIAARSPPPTSAVARKCSQRHPQRMVAMSRLEKRRRRQPSEGNADGGGRTVFVPMRRPGRGLTLASCPTTLISSARWTRSKGIAI